MSEFTIKNNEITAVISEHAAEMHSLKRNDNGIEVLWQGDPKYWAGRNPTLFPMVGSTWDKILHINGKEYVTGNHGFTRNSEFTCIEHDENKVVMELKDSEETLKQYPFHFELHNVYSIDGNVLTVRNLLKNTGDEVMPFNFGYHPAFNVYDWENARIVFDQPENVDGKEVSELSLDKERLAKTIIISNPKSSTYTLKDSNHTVIVTAPNFPWCAFWSPNAPFVCIEPWHSHTDFGEVKVPFEQREGTLLLKPGETFETGYAITVL
ncbi:MAG: aldose 1-epimerase family protein [Solobacterium sp.]|nr:aldose 1-epimerase family protein [Solobacterium sp.]